MSQPNSNKTKGASKVSSKVPPKESPKDDPKGTSNKIPDKVLPKVPPKVPPKEVVKGPKKGRTLMEAYSTPINRKIQDISDNLPDYDDQDDYYDQSTNVNIIDPNRAHNSARHWQVNSNEIMDLPPPTHLYPNNLPYYDNDTYYDNPPHIKQPFPKEVQSQPLYSSRPTQLPHQRPQSYQPTLSYQSMYQPTPQSLQMIPSPQMRPSLQMGPSRQTGPSVPSSQMGPSVPSPQMIPSVPSSQMIPSVPSSQMIPSVPSSQMIPSVPSSQMIPSQVEGTRGQSLLHYHVVGGVGWQRLMGYRKGMNLQPLEIMKGGVLYGMVFSYGGTEPIETDVIYVCKNIGYDVPNAGSKGVIAMINISSQIVGPCSFTLLAGESILVQEARIVWSPLDHVLVRSDKVSIYSKNLTGVDLEWYVTYDNYDRSN